MSANAQTTTPFETVFDACKKACEALDGGFASGEQLLAVSKTLRDAAPIPLTVKQTQGDVLSLKGHLVFDYEFIHISEQGIAMGLQMAARLVFLILFSSLLTYTTSPIRLTDGIEHLLNPLRRFGVPAHELAMMMTIALRFVPTLIEETDKIMKAQQSRGADFTTGSIVSRLKNMVPVLVPLFLSAFRRADELAMAMEARCYRGGVGRTQMKALKVTGIDYVAGVVFLFMTVGLAAVYFLC